jgi:hypothetical protein
VLRISRKFPATARDTTCSHVDGIAEEEQPRLAFLLDHDGVVVAGNHAAHLQVGYELGIPAVIGEYLPGDLEAALQLGAGLHLQHVAAAAGAHHDVRRRRRHGHDQQQQWQQARYGHGA